jgi:anti-sigma B factor antagonist
VGLTGQFLGVIGVQRSVTSVHDDPIVIAPYSALGGPVVTLKGEIDLAFADDLKRAVLAMALFSSRTVVIDMTDVTFIDSSGLDAIADAHELAPRCRIVLRNPSSWIRMVLTITDMASVCTF